MSSHGQRVANIESILEWCQKNGITWETPCAYDRIARAIMTNFHYTPTTTAEYTRDVMHTLQQKAKK